MVIVPLDTPLHVTSVTISETMDISEGSWIETVGPRNIQLLISLIANA